MTRVSVVLPTRNRGALLPRSIGSVLAQSVPDFELIVVDDASTDETAAVVAAIGDPRVRYEKLAVRGGVARARNRGVHLAQADWVAFQDSDDEWQPQRLERQLAAAASAPTAVLITSNLHLADDYPAAAMAPTPDGHVRDITAEARHWVPGAPTWLARRAALIDAGGFDPGLDCYEDWELALRLAARGRILLVNEALVVAHAAPGSLYADESARLRNLEPIVRRHRGTLAGHPRAWSYYCNALGQMTMQAGRPGDARAWFRQALRARPLDLRTWTNLGMSLCGTRLFGKYVAAARSLRRITS